MIDFEFEFQYAEEKQTALQKTGGSIPAGRCVVLCGGSGCGKSTLLRCINGLIPQFYEGELKGFCRLNGQDTAGLRIGEIGELAASVFQDPRSQFFTVNSSNEVAFGLENHGLPQDKIRRRVDEAFWIFHLERLKDRNVYELSSGERQFISMVARKKNFPFIRNGICEQYGNIWSVSILPMLRRKNSIKNDSTRRRSCFTGWPCWS